VKVGEYIRCVRDSRGISGPALATATGISQSSISRIERGAYKRDGPSAVELSSIAIALDVPLTDLVEMLRAEMGAHKSTSAAASKPPVTLDRLGELESRVATLEQGLVTALATAEAALERVQHLQPSSAQGRTR
jgi:transcriptional regulator with XRE-family HTH domain